MQRIDRDGHIEEYHITFTTPFNDIPTVTATQMGEGYNKISVTYNSSSKVIISAHLHNVGWNPVPFNFIAIGAR